MLGISSKLEKALQRNGFPVIRKDYRKTPTQHIWSRFNNQNECYHNCLSNYERLQIFRIVFDKVEFDNKIDDSVFKHYVNKTFHIENDYLFQLDPSDYDTVPQFIIDICDKTIQTDKHTSGYIQV
jgi:hypothetical protein